MVDSINWADQADGLALWQRSLAAFTQAAETAIGGEDSAATNCAITSNRWRWN
ncbi:hypothetical protein [Herbaspirillum sp. SJZ099]|uniref:hypothetical protein n=1 Tax=Herbaspirillum sp. SJZ099 TaxID=2572916 RepID=UPI00164516F3|nr:hypothetical protein [Herbaspirillum sp. SJZ099]